MQALIEQINSMMPELNLAIDDTTGQLNKQKDAVDNLIESTNQSLKAQAAQEDLTEIAKEQYETEKKIAEIKKKISEQNDIVIRFGRGDDYILTPLDKYQIETLQQLGYLLGDIQKEIAKATGKMQTEIAAAMEDAGVKALEYDDAIYREAGLNPTPLVQSPYLQKLMQDTYEQTLGEWKNFTATTADAVQETFRRLCDEAYMSAMSGAISPVQAVRGPKTFRFVSLILRSMARCFCSFSYCFLFSSLS